MSLTLIILLILAGLVFLVLEMLVIPGTTIIGISGFALIVFSIWEAYHSLGSPMGHYVLVGTIFFLVISFYFSLKSNTWNRLMLHTSISGKVNEIDTVAVQVGDEGKSVSRITPSGNAMINDELYEVHTNGEFIDPNTDIIVTRFGDNKIFVTRKP